MRHTLLPLPERMALRREYCIRGLIVLAFMISLAGIIGLTALFPVFLHAVTEEKLVKTSTVSTKAIDNNEFKDLQTSMLKSQDLLGSLVGEDDLPKMSDMVNSLVNMRNDLKFNAISFSKISSSTATITVQGSAPTRNSLLAFKKRFEATGPGNKVDLPVSELAKSANIQFTLQISQRIP